MSRSDRQASRAGEGPADPGNNSLRVGHQLLPRDPDDFVLAIADSVLAQLLFPQRLARVAPRLRVFDLAVCLDSGPLRAEQQVHAGNPLAVLVADIELDFRLGQSVLLEERTCK